MSRVLDSTDDYVSLDSVPVSAVPLTLSCWFTKASLSRGGYLVTLGPNHTGTNNTFSIWLPFSGVVYLSASVRTTVDAHSNTSGSINVTATDTWYHAVGRFVNSTTRMAYLNGVRSNNESSTDLTPANIDTYLIGRRGANFHDGLMAHVAIWNVALDEDEIAMLAARASPEYVRPSSLVSYLKHMGRDSDDRDFRRGLTMTNQGSAASSLEEPPLLWVPKHRKIFLPAAGGAGPVNNQIDLRWGLRSPVVQATDQRWAIRTAINASLDNRWILRGQVVSAIDLRWDTRGRTTSNSDLRWAVRSALANPLDLRWALRAEAVGAVDTRWAIRAQIAGDSDTRWAVRERIGGNSTLEWDVEGVVLQGLELQWDIESSVSSVSSDIGLQWSIRSTTVGASDLRWGIRSTLFSAGELQWSIRSRLDNTLDSRWAVRSRALSPSDLRWSISSVTLQASELHWAIRSRVLQPLDMRWSIVSGTLTALDLRWSIVGRLGALLDLRWGIGAVYADPSTIAVVPRSKTYHRVPLRAISNRVKPVRIFVRIPPQ